MANSCFAEITIFCGNTEKSQEFYEKILGWATDRSLYNLAKNSGICDGLDESQWPETRGDIADIELYEDQLTIITYTAWIPMMRVWAMLLERYLPEAKLFFHAEECGMGIFVTNDDSILDTVLFDPYEEGNLMKYGFPGGYGTVDKKTMAGLLKHLLETDENSLEKLILMFRESRFGEEAGIHEWNFSDKDDWA